MSATYLRSKTVLLLTTLLAMAPLAAGHYYQGSNPPECPDDGQVHDHRYTNGDLFCRSHPCANQVSGVSTVDPLTGRRQFEGPVLVTSTYSGEGASFAQFAQPQVTTRGHGDAPALAGDNQATVLLVGSERTDRTASSTWLVMAGPDVQTYTVNFRAVAFSPAGAAECESEHEQRN